MHVNAPFICNASSRRLRNERRWRLVSIAVAISVVDDRGLMQSRFGYLYRDELYEKFFFHEFATVFLLNNNICFYTHDKILLK